MSGLDSISLDASGFLDMDSFTDGSDLSDDALAGLRDTLLSDPVDEPSDDDWSALVDDAVVDAEAADASGPFTVDDEDGIAGVRDASDDDDTSADDGTTDVDDQGDDDLSLDDHDEPTDDTTDDGDIVDEGGADVDLETARRHRPDRPRPARPRQRRHHRRPLLRRRTGAGRRHQPRLRGLPLT